MAGFWRLALLCSCCLLPTFPRAHEILYQLCIKPSPCVESSPAPTGSTPVRCLQRCATVSLAPNSGIIAGRGIPPGLCPVTSHRSLRISPAPQHASCAPKPALGGLAWLPKEVGISSGIARCIDRGVGSSMLLAGWRGTDLRGTSFAAPVPGSTSSRYFLVFLESAGTNGGACVR